MVETDVPMRENKYNNGALERLSLPQYYNEEPVRRRLEKLGFSGRITHVDPLHKLERTMQFLDNAELYEIMIHSKQQDHKLFSKARNYKPSIDPSIGDYDYQKAHLLFWERLGVKCPRVVDSYKVGRDINRSEVIVMEDIDGSPHAQDMLVFNDKLGRYYDARDIRKWPILANKHDELNDAIDWLNKTKREVLDSCLNTVHRLAILGTYVLENSRDPRNVRLRERTFRAQNPFEHYFGGRGSYYLENLIAFIESAKHGIPREKLPDEVRTKIKETKPEYIQILSRLLPFFNDPKTERYMQGDEYLHHFMDTGENGESLIFDADRAKIGPVYTSFAKVLYNPPLFGMPLQLSREIFVNSLRQAKTLARELEVKHPGISRFVEDDERLALKRLETTALGYHLLRLAGIKAVDATENVAIHWKFTTWAIKYRSKIEFPLDPISGENMKPETMSTNPYRAQKSIQTLRESLREMVATIKRNREYPIDDIREPLSDLERFLEKYEIIPHE